MNRERDFELVLNQALEMHAAGASLEECLVHFPQYATELAPLLEIASFARKGLMKEEPIPTPDLKSGRQRFLQAASLVAPPRPTVTRRRSTSTWLRLAAVVSLALFILAGAGISTVAAQSLPGDILYPMKLGLEEVRLALTFNSQSREQFQLEQVTQRRIEVQSLIELKRAEMVEFRGVVEEIRDDSLVVSGMSVHTGTTATFQVGDWVFVQAWTTVEREIVARSVTVIEPMRSSVPIEISPTRTVETQPRATPTPRRHSPMETPTRQQETRSTLTPVDGRRDERQTETPEAPRLYRTPEGRTTERY